MRLSSLLWIVGVIFWGLGFGYMVLNGIDFIVWVGLLIMFFSIGLQRKDRDI